MMSIESIMDLLRQWAEQANIDGNEELSESLYAAYECACDVYSDEEDEA